jgi:hypothetical protein
MYMMTRNEMMEMLQASTCQVDFTKVNGDTRNMTCTLREDIIPTPIKSDPITQKAVRAVSEEVIPVWDIKAEGWRSFRVNSVTGFNAVSGA